MTNGPIIRQKYSCYTMTLAALTFITLLYFDGRTLDSGEPVWMKPLRFALAFGIHSITMIWIYKITNRKKVNDKWFNFCLDIQLCVFIIEMLCITLQASRGVGSHFNTATFFDESVYTIMGMAATVLMFTYPIQAWSCARQPGKRKIVSYAAALGYLAMIIGCFMGFQMTEPSDAQDIMSDQGIEIAKQGAHYISSPSGNNMAFFSWDMEKGDWRIAHFIGLHGIQLLPLLGLAAYYSNLRIRYIVPLFAISVVSFFCFLAFSIGLTLSDKSLFHFTNNVAILWLLCWLAPTLVLISGLHGYTKKVASYS